MTDTPTTGTPTTGTPGNGGAVPAAIQGGWRWGSVSRSPSSTTS